MFIRSFIVSMCMQTVVSATLIAVTSNGYVAKINESTGVSFRFEKVPSHLTAVTVSPSGQIMVFDGSANMYTLTSPGISSAKIVGLDENSLITAAATGNVIFVSTGRALYTLDPVTAVAQKFDDFPNNNIVGMTSVGLTNMIMWDMVYGLMYYDSATKKLTNIADSVATFAPLAFTSAGKSYYASGRLSGATDDVLWQVTSRGEPILIGSTNLSYITGLVELPSNSTPEPLSVFMMLILFVFPKRMINAS